MAHDLLTALGLALLIFGLFVFFTAVLGLYRFDYVLNRMHAAAVGDALGIFCILAGLMLLHGWSLSAAKTLLILVFLWLTSPVASHLIAEMEVTTIPNLHAECKEETR
ncbi:MAG: monovalent cation/H(+) antiporter subunit G [Oscillibacter sp.]|jgi:multicomponent Na+:H+ antiporter subunit G|nr:monovalent cation/H(+) antiporter subunit G [Oscillibacter sp.]